MANEITYNGRTIATFEEGQTATLVCAGKMAVSNIVVVFESVGRIIYNNMTTEVDAGKTATLFCAGKKMLTDVVVDILDNNSAEAKRKMKQPLALQVVKLFKSNNKKDLLHGQQVFFIQIIPPFPSAAHTAWGSRARIPRRTRSFPCR